MPETTPKSAVPDPASAATARRGRTRPVQQHTAAATRLTALPGGLEPSITSPSRARQTSSKPVKARPLQPVTDIIRWTGTAPAEADPEAARKAEKLLKAGPQPWRPPGAGRTGSVRRDPKRGTWTVRVEITGYDTEKRQQLQRRGFATEREARIALTAILTAQDSGSYQRIDPDITLASYLETHWFPALRTKGRKPSTMESYQRNLRVHVLPRIGHWPLASVTPAALDALYAALLAGSNGRRPLAPRTVRYIHTILHGVYAHAIRRDLVITNPTGRADPPENKACRAEPRPTWTAEQLQTFLISLEADPLRAPLMLLATTGMRRGEALALRWADTDLDAGELTVRRSLGRVANDIVETDPKTHAGRRRIVLDTLTLDVLGAHRTEQARRKLRAGIHPKIVQERLGHASIAITLDLYTHTDRASHAHAATAVAALLNPTHPR